MLNLETQKTARSGEARSGKASSSARLARAGVTKPELMAIDPITTVKRFSRDEMNLAEFPLAVLSTRHDSDVKTLEFSDSLTGKNGERIERKWIITGADKFGLPTASDDEVLLGLLRLSASQEFRDRKVTFTRYELLRILKWSTEGRSYGRLQRALDRLSGVRIKTSNGFFDNSSKSHQTRNFGIIDAYELNDGRGERGGDLELESSKLGAYEAVKPSFFVWSEAMFSSFQSGFIKKLDLDFLLGLKSAVSKRLYRFLDKHFWYRSKVQYNLFTFAHEKIGISRNYSYASQLKQQLEPAIDELMSLGFLQGCEYVGKGSATEIILVAGVETKQVSAAGANRVSNAGVNNTSAVHGATTHGAATKGAELPNTGDSTGEDATALVNAVEQRGLAKPQAMRLIGALTERQIQRAWLVVKHFDQLIAADSTRVNKNPAGFLYRAIERVDSFVLPGEKRDFANTKPANAVSIGGKHGVVGQGTRSPAARISQQGLAANLRKEVSSDAAQHSILKAQRESLKHQIEPQILERIRSEVTQTLEKLRGMISPARFHDTVEHAVEERLVKLLALQ